VADDDGYTVMHSEMWDLVGVDVVLDAEMLEVNVACSKADPLDHDIIGITRYHDNKDITEELTGAETGAIASAIYRWMWKQLAGSLTAETEEEEHPAYTADLPQTYLPEL
jgi:hypothetical protein